MIQTDKIGYLDISAFWQSLEREGPRIENHFSSVRIYHKKNHNIIICYSREILISVTGGGRWRESTIKTALRSIGLIGHLFSEILTLRNKLEFFYSCFLNKMLKTGQT